MKNDEWGRWLEREVDACTAVIVDGDWLCYPVIDEEDDGVNKLILEDNEGRKTRIRLRHVTDIEDLGDGQYRIYATGLEPTDLKFLHVCPPAWGLPEPKKVSRRFEVDWCKTYHATGSFEIEAPSRGVAEQIAMERIGDLEGSLQYDPDKDDITIYEL